jgi:serine/threonine-protein kinase
MSEAVEDLQTHPWELKPGARVGRWRVVDPLGTGSYGAVYQVEDVERPGALYALKLALRPSDLRAEREVALLARTEHPHVVRVHDWGSWRGAAGSHLYFVMDWVRGLPLHTWVETANPRLGELARVAEALALTLDWLHARGVRHRDLKPEHILIREGDAQPVLIDFGVGRQEGATTLTSTVVPPGTLHMRSPEAVDFHRLHHREAGARYDFQPTDDLYALGVCLFRALTGHYPFPIDLPWDLLALSILAHVPPSVSAINRRVPASLGGVVARLLEKKPQARYQAGRELHAALVAAREAGPARGWAEPVFAWEAGHEAPGVRRARLPEWPTAPATPPPDRDGAAPSLPSTGGPRLGVMLLPSAAAERDPMHGVVLARIPTGAPVRESSHGGSAAVVAMVAVLGLVAWLATGRGAGMSPGSSGPWEAPLEWAGTPDAAPVWEEPLPGGVRSVEAPLPKAAPVSQEALSGGTPEVGEAAAPPLVERPSAADAALMTQFKDTPQVKTPQPSSPSEKQRPGPASSKRGALGAAALVACSGAACSSAQKAEPASLPAWERQTRPPPEECPPDSHRMMKELRVNKGDRSIRVSTVGYIGQTRTVLLREGPIVLEVDQQMGTLPRDGVTVSGRFFFAKGRVHGWFTRVHTEEGPSYPICMELIGEDLKLGWPIERPGAEPGTVHVWPVGQIITVYDRFD